MIWNLPWRREFRTDEADLYDHLINIPSQVHLFPTSEEGLFFVKYSRELIHSSHAANAALFLQKVGN
jgi:hypothetical protein